MTWFKVDDKLHSHPKARKVRRTHQAKRRDSAPFGLWVLAGSWASDSGTDGFIPSEILDEWDDDAPELAHRLTDAGLWWETVVNGEHGFGFHDWRDYLPRPDGIEDASESGMRGNHVRWHENRGAVSPSCPFCSQESPYDRGDIGCDDRGDIPIAIAPNREPVPVPNPDTTSELVALRPEVERICERLADRIAEDGSKRPSITKAWRDAARLMLDRDGISEADALAAIDWCQDHHFWRSNILSLPTLRKQYVRLRKEAARPAAPRSQQATDELFARAAQRLGVQQ